MSDDLPTPPLPDATAITRVRGRERIALSAAPPRSCVESAAFPPASSRRTRAHGGDARDAPTTRSRPRPRTVAHRAAGDGERDRDLDPGAIVEHDVAHHVELGDRPRSSGSITYSSAVKIASLAGSIVARAYQRLPSAVYVVARGMRGEFPRSAAGSHPMQRRSGLDEG